MRNKETDMNESKEKENQTLTYPKDVQKRLKEIGMTEKELDDFWDNYNKVMDARAES